MSTFFGPGPSSWAEDDKTSDPPAPVDSSAPSPAVAVARTQGDQGQRPPADKRESPHQRRRTYTWPLVAVLVCLLAIIGATLAGITQGVRWQTPPPQAPELSAEQEAQVNAAESALALAGAANNAGELSANGTDKTLWQSLASASEDIAQVLGGRWTPWPEEVPEGVSVPDYAQPVPADPTWQWFADKHASLLQSVGELLPQISAAQAEVLAQAGAKLTQVVNLLASSQGEKAYGAADFAQALELDFSTENTPIVELPPIGPVIDSASVQATDAALSAYDVAAALTPKDKRETVSQRRTELAEWISETLQSGIEDSRQGYYDLPAITGDSQPETFIAWAEQLMASHYLHLTSLVPDSQRVFTMHAVLVCLDQVRVAGGEPLVLGIDSND